MLVKVSYCQIRPEGMGSVTASSSHELPVERDFFFFRESFDEPCWLFRDAGIEGLQVAD